VVRQVQLLIINYAKSVPGSLTTVLKFRINDPCDLKKQNKKKPFLIYVVLRFNACN